MVGPGLYQQAEFGGESRLVALIRAHLPASIGALAEIAYNVPAWWRLRQAARRFRPDLIYERYNLFHLAGTWLARWTRVPLFLEVNAPLAAERARFGGLGLPGLAARLEAYVWRSADKVLAVTGVLKRIVERAGVPAGRIEVVPERHRSRGIRRCAAQRASWRPRRPGLRRLRARLARTGRRDRRHGGGTRRRPVDLIVVGDGPARAALERQAAALGLVDRVRFTGLRAREQIPALVAGFDIALQPRVVDYASPLKIFEYMAAGRAIVAPDQANIREILPTAKPRCCSIRPGRRRCGRRSCAWRATPPCATGWDRRPRGDRSSGLHLGGQRAAGGPAWRASGVVAPTLTAAPHRPHWRGMRNFSDLTEREVLALAIANEEEDNRIYTDIAEGLREEYPASAHVFTEMAEEESEHRQRLLELYRAEIRRAHPADPPPGRARLHPPQAGLADLSAEHRRSAQPRRKHGDRDPAVLPPRRRAQRGRLDAQAARRPGRGRGGA